MQDSFYDDPEVFAAYGQHRHPGVSSPNHVMEEPALMRALGPVTGLRVADLGCGDASIGPALLDAGCVSYYGIDSSAAMVAQATAGLRGRQAEIELAGIEAFSFPANTFDLIISRLALHYLADLEPVLRACAGCLTPGGRLVFTVVHPVLTAQERSGAAAEPAAPRTSWLVDDYFSRGPRRRPWMGRTVTWHHRTIEEHVSAVQAAGFTLEVLSECPPDRSRFGGDDAEYARRLRTPLFLLLAGCLPG